VVCTQIPSRTEPHRSRRRPCWCSCYPGSR
jgi:hypothetical protein